MNKHTILYTSIISLFFLISSISSMQRPFHPSAQTFYSAFIISINKCSETLSYNTLTAQTHLKNAHRSLTGLYHQNASLKITTTIDSFLNTPRNKLALGSINIGQLKKDVQESTGQNTGQNNRYFLQ